MEDKSNRIHQQLNKLKGPSKRPTKPRGKPTTPPTCTFCGKIGHTVDKFSAKRDTNLATTPKPPSAYMADGASTGSKTMIHETCMAIVFNNSADSEKVKTTPHLEDSPTLPSLTGVPSCGSEFSDPSTPVRYLGLCCATNMHIIRCLVNRGRYIAEIYLCDKDPLARRVALEALQQLVWRSPGRLSSHLSHDILSGRILDHIPQDVKLVDSASIITLFGVNMVIASPGC